MLHQNEAPEPSPCLKGGQEMNFDNSGMELSEFCSFLVDTFPIGSVDKIKFIPKGEDGYGYQVETKDGSMYFAKVQAKSNDVHFSSALTAVSALHYQYQKAFVVAPISTFSNKSFELYGDKVVSLFPFIMGTSLYDEGEFVRHIDEIMEMMADLHSVDCREFPQLPVEKFENPFEKTILHLLMVAESREFHNEYQQKAAVLLLKEREDIEATLEKMRIMQQSFLKLSLEYTVTHGDPNFANILRDEEHTLHLIDWGELAISSIERDLMFFIEVDGNPLDFKRFLSSYMVHRPKANVHPEIIEFYLYRWCLQEIADYGSRLLLQNVSVEEMQHSWNELQPYLPITHQSIKDTIERIR